MSMVRVGEAEGGRLCEGDLKCCGGFAVIWNVPRSVNVEGSDVQQWQL